MEWLEFTFGGSQFLGKSTGAIHSVMISSQQFQAQRTTQITQCL